MKIPRISISKHRRDILVGDRKPRYFFYNSQNDFAINQSECLNWDLYPINSFEIKSNLNIS